jgi:hypothetical protein
VIHQIGDPIDNTAVILKKDRLVNEEVDKFQSDIYLLLGKRSESIDKYGQNIAYTCQQLETIVDSDQTVITRVHLKIVLFHNIHSRCRDGTTVAAACFQKQTQIRAILLAACSSFKYSTAEVEISL